MSGPRQASTAWKSRPVRCDRFRLRVKPQGRAATLTGVRRTAGKTIPPQGWKIRIRSCYCPCYCPLPLAWKGRQLALHACIRPPPFSRRLGAAGVGATQPQQSRGSPRVLQPIAHCGWAVAVDRVNQGRSVESNYRTVSFLEAAVAFFGSSSVSTPSAYVAWALASSTSWGRLKVRDTLP